MDAPAKKIPSHTPRPGGSYVLFQKRGLSEASSSGANPRALAVCHRSTSDGDRGRSGPHRRHTCRRRTHQSRPNWPIQRYGASAELLLHVEPPDCDQYRRNAQPVLILVFRTYIARLLHRLHPPRHRRDQLGIVGGQHGVPSKNKSRKKLDLGPGDGHNGPHGPVQVVPGIF